MIQEVATFTLLTMPSEDYPSLPAMPPAAGIHRQRRVRVRGQPVGHRGRPGRHAARADPACGSRSRARRSPWCPPTGTGWPSASCAGTPARPDLSAAGAGAGPGHAEAARALTAAPRCPSRWPCPARKVPAAKGLIGFEGAGRRTTTRLLGGDFPRYQSLLPNQVNSVAELAAGPFAEAVKRVSLVAERNTAVRLSFSPDESCWTPGTATRPRPPR